MKPVLLATDGSPSAEAATQEAIDLAHVFGAPLIVVSVAQVVLPAYTGMRARDPRPRGDR